jgi:hypothetical protein
MSLLAVQGGATGTGTVTLLAPITNTNQTLTLPDATGTVQVSGAAISGTTGTFSGNLLFNSGYGSAAVAYGCRAWVNFKGTGTVSIYGSGNVSSVTDNGTGDFTVNFTTAMQDANYAGSGLAEGGSSGDGAITIEKASGAQSASSMRVFVKQGSTTLDRDYNYLSFFR